jgi:phosphonate transport system substrate-binding protein
MKNLLLCLLCFTLICSCSNHNPSKKNIPKELTFAVIPSDDYAGTIRHAEDLCKYLEKKLNMKIILYKATDYTAVIEAMKSHKVQIAHFGPFSYVLANRKAGAESMVCVSEKAGVFHSYKSLILANSKSKIKTLDDLKSNSNNLTLSFVDPASTSGHLVPREFLTSIGLDPESKFKQMVFSTSHGASILTLISGKVDIAAAGDVYLQRLIVNGKVKQSDFNILWTSAPIPPDPICIQKDLDTGFKQKVKEAFLALPTEAPEIWKSYMRFEFTGDPNADTYTYMEAHDSIYNSVRKIFDAIDYENLIKRK